MAVLDVDGNLWLFTSTRLVLDIRSNRNSINKAGKQQGISISFVSCRDFYIDEGSVEEKNSGLKTKEKTGRKEDKVYLKKFTKIKFCGPELAYKINFEKEKIKIDKKTRTYLKS